MARPSVRCISAALRRFCWRKLRLPAFPRGGGGRAKPFLAPAAMAAGAFVSARLRRAETAAPPYAPSLTIRGMRQAPIQNATAGKRQMLARLTIRTSQCAGIPVLFFVWLSFYV